MWNEISLGHTYRKTFVKINCMKCKENLIGVTLPRQKVPSIQNPCSYPSSLVNLHFGMALILEWPWFGTIPDACKNTNLLQVHQVYLFTVRIITLQLHRAKILGRICQRCVVLRYCLIFNLHVFVILTRQDKGWLLYSCWLYFYTTNFLIQEVFGNSWMFPNLKQDREAASPECRYRVGTGKGMFPNARDRNFPNFLGKNPVSGNTDL